VHVPGRPEVPVREAARLGGLGEHMLARGVILMEGVVEPGQHAGAVLEGGVRGDVLHSLAVDPDLAAVVETRQELLAGVRERPGLRPRARRGVWRLLRGLRFSGTSHVTPPGRLEAVESTVRPAKCAKRDRRDGAAPPSPWASRAGAGRSRSGRPAGLPHGRRGAPGGEPRAAPPDPRPAPHGRRSSGRSPRSGQWPKARSGGTPKSWRPSRRGAPRVWRAPRPPTRRY